MEIPRIATLTIATDKTDDLIQSWDTIKSIVNDVFEECLRVTGQIELSTSYATYWKIGTDLLDRLHLTGLNPSLIVMHTFNNKDQPFLKIILDKILGTIKIQKCIDVRHMYPFLSYQEGLTMMSNVVDRIIDKLEETFGKKEKEEKTEMNKDIESVFKALGITGWDTTAVSIIKQILEVSKTSGVITRGTIRPSAKELRRKKGHPTPTFNEFEQRILKDIHSVMFNRPSTVIFWNEFDENGKQKCTTVTCKPEDTFSKEEGLLQAIAKHYGITPKLLGYLAKNAEDRTEQTETHKKNKEARRQKALDKAEERVDTLLNEEETTATIGFLNNEEE